MPAGKPTTILLTFTAAIVGCALAVSPLAFAAPADYEGISADGKIAFFSTADKLVSGDTDNRGDVYMRSFDSAVGSYVTREISTGPSGGNDAFDALFDRASSDGGKIFFSTDERLVSGDTDKTDDVYLRDVAKGLTVLVTQGEAACAPSCGNADADADFAEASADGSAVLFSTDERLAGGDTDGAVDVYRRDVVAGTTVLATAGEASCQPGCGNGALPATLRGLSGDGSAAFFATEERLSGADTDTAIDVYSRALPAGPTTLVSRGDPGCASCGNDDSSDAVFAGSSQDGAAAFFETDEGLVPGDDDDGNDVYRRAGGATALVSGGSEEQPANFRAASASGDRAFFATAESLVVDDTNDATDVYQWQGGAPSLITSGDCCSSTFAAADGTSVFFTTLEKLDLASDTDESDDVYVQESGGGAPDLVSRGAASCAPSCGNGSAPALFNRISANSKAFFSTAEALVAEDGDADVDVYVRDLEGSTTALVSTEGVFCPTPGGCDASFRGASADGSRVFFQTTERLTEGDVDSELDVYERASAQTRLVTVGNSVELGPSTPALTGTSPGSPGASTSPAILGQADPGTAIKLYATPDCSGEVVATGIAAQLGGSGIAATVPAGSTKSFRATATDGSGDTSACSNPVTYTQQDAAPPPPPPPPPPGGEGTGGGDSGGGGGSGSSGGSGGAKVGGRPGVTYVTPRTRITFAPAGKTVVRRPVFRFTDSTGQEGSTFRCKVDRAPWRACNSPLKLKMLKLGRHAFQVKAVNAVGEKEPTPQKRKFKVVVG